MPGPVSDSYDPEFGTGSNAHDVGDAVRSLRSKVTDAIGNSELKNIVEVVHSRGGGAVATLHLDERELRVLRFALNRALESL